jgi:hypothetical protein
MGKRLRLTRKSVQETRSNQERKKIMYLKIIKNSLEPNIGLFAVPGLFEKPKVTTAPPPTIPARLRAFLTGRFGPDGDAGYYPSGDTRVRIDIQLERDVYPYFCKMYLGIPEIPNNAFLLQLDNLPMNDEIKAIIENHAGRIIHKPYAICTYLALRPKNRNDLAFLRDLARSVHRLVKRGNRYDDRMWKFVVPRAADSLKRLAHLLQEFNRSLKRVRSTNGTSFRSE